MENKQSSLPPLIAALRVELDNYFSTCASLMAFYAAITLDVGQLPSKKKIKKALIDFVQTPANSFDVESGIEQSQSRESSSSN